MVNVQNMKDKNQKYAVMLAFDVEIDSQAIELSKKLEITIIGSRYLAI